MSNKNVYIIIKIFKGMLEKNLNFSTIITVFTIQITFQCPKES